MENVYQLICEFFFPHEKNNYKARSLHTSSLLLYIIVLLSIQISVNIFKSRFSNVLGYATDISIERVLSLVNEKRAQNGLQPLKISEQLSTAATNKASDMFSKNYWAHISPTGTTPWFFINRAGYNYVYAGENLARSFNTAEEVVDAWMNSPAHRANLLKPQYSDMGLAIMNGRLNSEDTTLVVQEFGSKSNEFVASRNVEGEANPKPVTQAEPAKFSVGNQKVITLPFSYTKTVSMFLIELLLFVLLVDSLYIWKHKIFRISGHSLAHIIFLAALIGAMGATGIGVIL